MSGTLMDSLKIQKTQTLRCINYVMSGFFMLAAYVNINDGDWYFWVPMYTMPALLCLSAAFVPSVTERFLWRKFMTLDLGVCLLYGVYQIYTVLQLKSLNWRNPLAHEEVREMLGLVIILAWIQTARWLSARSQPGKNLDQVEAQFLWLSALVPVIPICLWSFYVFSNRATSTATSCGS